VLPQLDKRLDVPEGPLYDMAKGIADMPEERDRPDPSDAR
jgi:hypothetical protein